MLSVPIGASRLVADAVSPEPDSGGSEAEHQLQHHWSLSSPFQSGVATSHFQPGIVPSSFPLVKSASDSLAAPTERASVRRCSNPVVGSPREQGGINRRRSSEGNSAIFLADLAGQSSPHARVPAVSLGSADWTETASAIEHIFVPTSSSIDGCYLGQECLRQGPRLKCVACRVISHKGCVATLTDRFPCKQTFRECVRKYREQSDVHHHWVSRRQLKGKCRHCGKAFHSKLGSKFSTSVVGDSCSWCKVSYHLTDNCKAALMNDKICDLGVHGTVIVPPSWIVKLPRKGSFKSSLKSSPKRCIGSSLSTPCQKCPNPSQKCPTHSHKCPNSSQKCPDERVASPSQLATPTLSASARMTKEQKEHRLFVLKPIPVSNCYPVIVFINPKSGGNQGAKLMQKFQWLLNPRQVFDLTKGGPQPAIDLFRNVPGLRILACGGDGTVGWVLSVLDGVLDRSHVETVPAVGVLPLGTGNDLSRSLGWGGGYTDEPITKILLSLAQAEEIDMDRWGLKVTPRKDFPPSEKGVDKLPLDVVNNYFSLGVDAQIALQFHEARERNPHKFNSRIRNKMFYTQAGGKDLLLRKWKTLTDHIKVECDGKDITNKLKELKVHSVVFINIPCFSSGTRPWNRQNGDQKLDDGLIEVVGLTTYQLPLLQAGGHGHCIIQCKTAKISTTKTIPMQIDGEAVRLNPATIELSLLNRAKMLAKRKSGTKTQQGLLVSTPFRLGVSQITMYDYELNHYDKDKLKLLAKPLGEITTDVAADLEQLRSLVSRLQENNIPARTKRSSHWCFLDSVTAVRFFRIDLAQENLHFLADICDSILYILETEVEAEILPDASDGLVFNDDLSTQLSNLSGHDELATPHDDLSTPLSPLPPVIKSSMGSSGYGSSSLMIQDIARNEDEGVFQLPGEHRQHRVGRKAVEVFTPGVEEKTTEGILKASRLGDLKMLTELWQEGYSLLSIDETGKTGLHYGARFGHKDIIKFLLEKAPALIIDIVDTEKGQTALHKAAAYKRRTICCMLVSKGASLLIPDFGGLTPRQLSLAAEDHELSAYLESQETIRSCQEFETPVFVQLA